MDTIIKRDGRSDKFDQSKIEHAIEQAFLAVDSDINSLTYQDIISKIADSIAAIAHESKSPLTVEQIQDLVERKLMATSRKDVARAYITYRNKRTKIRERNSKFRNAIREKVYAKNVQNQNANVDEYSFGGRRGEADSVVLKEMALDELMDPMHRDLHLNNKIYIHDLDSYLLGMHNCLTMPLDRALNDGVDIKDVDLRSSGWINTAMQLVAVLFQTQSLMQFGGVSAGHIDWTMVPFVRKSFYKHFLDGLKYILTEQDYESIMNEFNEEG